MREVFDQIRQVAPMDCTVLINGESGTGKELVARAIHRASRRSGALVPVNCGALTQELIASELFGHEKGSFTGANRRHLGVFERATGGTLFLDEITEMPIAQQPHLLRALETRRVTRVGGEAELPFDARVVTASNRSIAQSLDEGRLREDLYFRLSVFPIALPALRERMEDVPLLANAFLDELNEEQGTAKRFSERGMDRLMAWHWPGNVRELRHAVHRAFIVTPEPCGELRIPDSVSVTPVASDDGLRAGRSIRDVERQLIECTLDHLGGDKRASAEMLGISLKTLYNRLAEWSQEAEPGNAQP